MQRPEVGMNLQPQGWEDGKQAPKVESRRGRCWRSKQEKELVGISRPQQGV